MTKAEQKSRKFTFGNILLTLLVIGTFAVIGLMTKLYIELTKTPEITAQMHQEQKPQIEVMSPNAQPGDKPVYRDANTQVASKPAASAQQAAQTVASAPTTDSNNNIKEAALNSGAAPIKKPATSVKKAAKSENAGTKEVPLKANNAIQGEVPLRPTNVQPTANREPAPAATGERPLKPRNVEKPKPREVIDELF